MENVTMLKKDDGPAGGASQLGPRGLSNDPLLTELEVPEQGPFSGPYGNAELHAQYTEQRKALRVVDPATIKPGAEYWVLVLANGQELRVLQRLEPQLLGKYWPVDCRRDEDGQLYETFLSSKEMPTRGWTLHREYIDADG